jgi:hypothetical protein
MTAGVCTQSNDTLMTTIIHFVCHPDSLVCILHVSFLFSFFKGTPILLSSDGCMSVFEWRTSAACPLAKDSGSDCKVVDPATNFLYDLSPLMKDEDYVFVELLVVGYRLI